MIWVNYRSKCDCYEIDSLHYDKYYGSKEYVAAFVSKLKNIVMHWHYFLFFTILSGSLTDISCDMNSVTAQTGISGLNISPPSYYSWKPVICHSYLIDVQLQGASEPTHDLKTASRLEAVFSKPHFYMKPNLQHFMDVSVHELISVILI